jgi:cation channel sperm-associated protein 3
MMMAIILGNVIFIAVETEVVARQKTLHILPSYQQTELIFIGVYTAEFLLKVYAEPLGYWKNNYNRLDFGVLILCYLQWILASSLPNIDSVAILRIIRGTVS